MFISFALMCLTIGCCCCCFLCMLTSPPLVSRRSKYLPCCISLLIRRCGRWWYCWWWWRWCISIPGHLVEAFHHQRHLSLHSFSISTVKARGQQAGRCHNKDTDRQPKGAVSMYWLTFHHPLVYRRSRLHPPVLRPQQLLALFLMDLSTTSHSSSLLPVNRLWLRYRKGDVNNNAT